MKNIFFLILSVAMLFGANAQKSKAQTPKANKCVVPPAPTVGSTIFGWTSDVYCPHDTIYQVKISVPNRYTDNEYIFRFSTTATLPSGCYTGYDMRSSDGTIYLYPSKCSGCWQIGQTYTVKVQSHCANDSFTDFSSSVTFTIQPPKK